MNSGKEAAEGAPTPLDWDPRVDATNVTISVENGAVTLNGSVNNYFERLAAEQAVRRTKGVRAIVQNLEVRIPENADHDDLIARRLRDVLAWDPMIPEKLIGVSVADGWVTLTSGARTNCRLSEMILVNVGNRMRATLALELLKAKL